MEVGFDDIKLTFNKAVRILITGQAGKNVGYSRSGNFYTITNICSADTQEAGDALPVEGDCKADVGSDLVIWTKHFTKFTTYTISTTNAGGGGGGGGYTPVNNNLQNKSTASTATTTLDAIISSTSTVKEIKLENKVIKKTKDNVITKWQQITNDAKIVMSSAKNLNEFIKSNNKQKDIKAQIKYMEGFTKKIVKGIKA